MADASIFGPGTVVKGEINGEDRVFVRGKVVGTIDIDSAAVVEPSAFVKAKVSAKEVEISGTVEGHITGFSKVEILPGGRVVGNVKTARILISVGAVLKGLVDMVLGEG